MSPRSGYLLNGLFGSPAIHSYGSVTLRPPHYCRFAFIGDILNLALTRLLLSTYLQLSFLFLELSKKVSWCDVKIWNHYRLGLPWVVALHLCDRAPGYLWWYGQGLGRKKAIWPKCLFVLKVTRMEKVTKNGRVIIIYSSGNFMAWVCFVEMQDSGWCLWMKTPHLELRLGGNV